MSWPSRMVLCSCMPPRGVPRSVRGSSHHAHRPVVEQSPSDWLCARLAGTLRKRVPACARCSAHCGTAGLAAHTRGWAMAGPIRAPCPIQGDDVNDCPCHICVFGTSFAVWEDEPGTCFSQRHHTKSMIARSISKVMCMVPAHCVGARSFWSDAGCCPLEPSSLHGTGRGIAGILA
jgi:hypothetical protein